MITHEASPLAAATDAVTALANTGASAGVLRLYDDTTLITEHDLSATAFAAAGADGWADANAIASDDAVAAGTIDIWKIYDGDSPRNLVMSGKAGQRRAIAAVTTGAGGKFEVAGDHSTEFAAGEEFLVQGSTNNDGTWRVASVSYNGGTSRTEITVAAWQTVGATADGYLSLGQIQLVQATVEIGTRISFGETPPFKYQAIRQ